MKTPLWQLQCRPARLQRQRIRSMAGNLGSARAAAPMYSGVRVQVPRRPRQNDFLHDTLPVPPHTPHPWPWHSLHSWLCFHSDTALPSATWMIVDRDTPAVAAHSSNLALTALGSRTLTWTLERSLLA